MVCPHQDGNPARNNSVAPGRALLGSLSTVVTKDLCFFFFFLRCGLKTDLLRPGTQLEFLQDKRLEVEASLGAGWGGRVRKT